MNQSQGTTAQSSGARCDFPYFKTLPALMKIIQVVSSLIAFICPQGWTMTECGACIEWFRTAAMSGLLFSCIFLIVYFLHVDDKFHTIPWLKIDLVGCVFWTIFDLATATHLAISLSGCRSYGSCGFISDATGAIAGAIIFGYIAMIAYGCDAGLRLLGIMKAKR